MSHRRRAGGWRRTAAALLAALAAAGAACRPGDGARREPDVEYAPTPPAVVEAMLDVAQVGEGDVVYDLGCGDGRIVVGAARRGARRAVGVDVDPDRIRDARANVARAGVADRVEILERDLFEMELSDATVVTLYLSRELNVRLRPTLLRLSPGTRIVSHAFDMGDWKPDEVRQVGGSHVYSWTVPAGGAQLPGAPGRGT